MELKNLKTFQIAAYYLNLTKAAKHLGYAQPTITLQIQLLERELGHKLFNRVGKKTTLTPVGELLKQYTDRLFEVVDEMDLRLKQLDNFKGSLVIAASEFYCSRFMSHIISTYLKTNPDVNLKLITCSSLEAQRLVTLQQADLAIICGKSDTKEVEQIPLNTEDILMVTTKEIYEQNDVPTILKNYPFFSFRVGYIFNHLMESCLTEINYHPPNTIELGSEETIKRTVLNQAGIALLSEDLIKDELHAGKLSVLHRFEQRVDTTMIYLKNRSGQNIIQSFSQFLQEEWQTVI